MPDGDTKIVNLREKPFDVFIGRPSKWGNPFKIGKDGNRELVIEKYRDYIKNSFLIKDIHELKGRTLGCYCKPLACHGDVLKELADA